MCKFLPSGKRNSKNGLEDGLYPLYYCSIKGFKYLNDYDFDDYKIIINKTNGSGKCAIYLAEGKHSIANSTVVFQGNNEIINRYVYYYLIANKSKIEQLYEGSLQKQLNLTKFKYFPIPVPCIEKQQEIIEGCEKLIENKDIKYNNTIISLQKNINDNMRIMKLLFQ